MNTRSLYLLVTVLGLASLALWGCGGDDDGGGTPEPEDCAITITGPATATVFQPGNDDQDDCTIRWNHAGEAPTVDITLHKAGQQVGVIAAGDPNDGTYFWEADNMGAANGDDFTIRVTATSEAGCFGESGEFTIINTEGCNFTFTNNWLSGYFENTVVDLTWESYHHTGSVDIELHTVVDGYRGSLVQGLPDEGRFEWTVDSLNYANFYGFYRLKLVDSNLETCYAWSDTFSITDPNICLIDVVQPAEGVVWAEGSDQDIVLSITADVSAVDLRLYAGSMFINHIAQGVDVTQDPSYTWTVNDWDNTQGGTSSYRIRAFNVDDDYCVGVSELFTITPAP